MYGRDIFVGLHCNAREIVVSQLRLVHLPVHVYSHARDVSQTPAVTSPRNELGLICIDTARVHFGSHVCD